MKKNPGRKYRRDLARKNRRQAGKKRVLEKERAARKEPKINHILPSPTKCLLLGKMHGGAAFPYIKRKGARKMNEQLMMDLKAFQKEEKRLRKLGIIGTYDSNFFTSPVSADFLVQLKESAFMDSFPRYTVHPLGTWKNIPYALLGQTGRNSIFCSRI